MDVLVDAPEVGANLQDHLVAGLAPEARVGHAVQRRGRRPAGAIPLGATRDADLEMWPRRTGSCARRSPTAPAWPRDSPTSRSSSPPAPYVGEGLVPLPGEGLTVGAILLRPRSRGTIRLASADPTREGRHRPGLPDRPGGLDEATILAGLAECERLIDTDALRAVTTGGWIQPEGGERMTPAERAELSLRRYSHTLYHPVGTARMGSDAASVVDPDLRVRGVRGLRVADASVMPTVIRGPHERPRDRDRRGRRGPDPARGRCTRSSSQRSSAERSRERRRVGGRHPTRRATASVDRRCATSPAGVGDGRAGECRSEGRTPRESALS